MKTNKKAFTLVEIMAASAIMTIIVLAVLNVTTNILKTWNSASGELKNKFDGSVICNILQEDFESAVIVPHITFFATCDPFEYNIGYNARLMRKDIAEHDDTPFKLIYIGCSSILSSARGSTCHLSANCLMKKVLPQPHLPFSITAY